MMANRNDLSRHSPNLDVIVQSLLADRAAAGQLRSLRTVQSLDSTHVEINGRLLVNFCSNNYLGLNCHPRVIEAAEKAMSRCGFGSGSAALICGHTQAHESAQLAIAAWKQTESAVLLPSGYQANQAAIQTFAAVADRAGLNVRFLLDKLVHASILDAAECRDRRSVRIFPHNHLAKLSMLLQDSDDKTLNVVVTESIFSMDGDAADLRGLAELKQKHPFTLLLDEAHASGVYGPNGAGFAHEQGLQSFVDASVVTLSKAIGGIGGAICGSALFCQSVVNFGRPFIYTTNLPPAAAAAAEAAIQIMRDEPQRQKRVREMALKVRRNLIAAGVPVLPGDSPIICIRCASEQSVLSAAETLLQKGLLVAAVRPPTVAPGACRLRVTLCSSHTDEEIDRLAAELCALDHAG
jgi:8-amino-7-oxononanoate synthase